MKISGRLAKINRAITPKETKQVDRKSRRKYFDFMANFTDEELDQIIDGTAGPDLLSLWDTAPQSDDGLNLQELPTEELESIIANLKAV